MKLPAVRRITIELELDLDKRIIDHCRIYPKSKKGINIKSLKWPEAVKALYKEFSRKENELLHIKSCCEKALRERVCPTKEALWNEILINKET